MHSKFRAIPRLTWVIAIGFSYFTHRKTPAGRTTDQIKNVARKSAKLLAIMSEGNAAGYTQHKAGHWLASARDLIEEMKNLFELSSSVLI